MTDVSNQKLHITLTQDSFQLVKLAMNVSKRFTSEIISMNAVAWNFVLIIRSTIGYSKLFTSRGEILFVAKFSIRAQF